MIGPTTYFVLSKKSDGKGKPPAGIPRPSVNFSVSGAMAVIVAWFATCWMI